MRLAQALREPPTVHAGGFGPRARRLQIQKRAFAEGSAGYALVDALVALLILAMALTLCLQATYRARVVADQAWEVRRAQTLLAHLLETGPRTLEDNEGESDGFAWRLETRPTGAEQPVAVCRRNILVRSERSRRTYEAATLETCPQLAAK